MGAAGRGSLLTLLLYRGTKFEAYEEANAVPRVADMDRTERLAWAPVRSVKINLAGSYAT